MSGEITTRKCFSRLGAERVTDRRRDQRSTAVLPPNLSTGVPARRMEGHFFLIANPGLENRVGPFKNRHLKISNSDYIAVFQSGFHADRAGPGGPWGDAEGGRGRRGRI